MKGPCMSKEQCKGIHYRVNDQGFAMYYRVLSNMVSHLNWMISDLRESIQQSKGWIDFFSYLKCFKRSFNVVF